MRLNVDILFNIIVDAEAKSMLENILYTQFLLFDLYASDTPTSTHTPHPHTPTP